MKRGGRQRLQAGDWGHGYPLPSARNFFSAPIPPLHNYFLFLLIVLTWGDDTTIISYMNRNSLLLAIVISIQTALLSAGLIFSILTYDKANKVDRFYRAVSSDYRAITGGGSVADAQRQGGAASDECVDPSLFDLANEPTKGDENAPVTIVEYSDFECPFCARFFQGAYPQIVSDYIDTGVAKLVFKDFPLDNIHPLAVPAAVAANCVYETMGDDSFFAYHDRVFASQPLLTNENIRQWAIQEGLTDEQYDRCVNSEEYTAEIYDDLREGQMYGATGTPSFFINGRLLIGSQPIGAFADAIEMALTEDAPCSG